MNNEEKVNICASCGRTMGSSEKSLKTNENLVCFQCEQKTNIPITNPLSVSTNMEMSIAGCHKMSIYECSRLRSLNKCLMFIGPSSILTGGFLEGGNWTYGDILAAVFLVASGIISRRFFIAKCGKAITITVNIPALIFSILLTLLFCAPILNIFRYQIGLSFSIILLFLFCIIPLGISVFIVYKTLATVIGIPSDFIDINADDINKDCYNLFLKGWKQLNIDDTIDKMLSLVGNPTQKYRDEKGRYKCIYEITKEGKLLSTTYSNIVVISDDKVVEIIPDSDWEEAKRN